MNYYTVQNYHDTLRELLQDEVANPYRYSDQTLINALNNAIAEISRIRPDVFIDLKYQQPMPKKGVVLNDGVPGFYTTSMMNSTVPIPGTLFMPVCWYMSSYCQFLDTDDTQDVRAQSFSQKFIGSLIQLAA